MAQFWLGVLGNIVAALLCAIAAWRLILRKVWREHVAPHLQMIRELHHHHLGQQR
jgi:uncharacterized membrane protein